MRYKHYSEEDTKLRITICGADSEERRNSVQELGEAIEELWRARPLFTSHGGYTRVEEEQKYRKKLASRFDDPKSD
jgi:hypothetical protein